MPSGRSLGIQYSICNEDTASELRAFGGGRRRVLSIAAGGGRAVGLLLGDPGEVVALDANPAQVHLSRLKQSAIAQLGQAAYLRFLGLQPSRDRTSVLARLLDGLPRATREFWGRHARDVEAGLAYRGTYERGVRRFAGILRLFHADTVTALMREGAPSRLSAQVERHLARPGLRALCRILFSPWSGRFLIGDRSFCGPERTRPGTFLLDRLRDYARTRTLAASFVLHLYLLGRIDTSAALPVHLEIVNYDRVRSRVGRIRFVEGELLEYLRGSPDRSFDAFSLSDIGSYADANHYRQILEEILRVGVKGAVVCEREFLRQPRRFVTWPRALVRMGELEAVLNRTDRAVGYTFVCSRLEP